MKRKIIALVGRPNVGKSTLFNRLARKRIAIVEDRPGITRDRNFAPIDYRGYRFTLIDTGGFEPDAKSNISIKMRQQSQLAVEEADAIIFLVDRTDGWSSGDQDIYQYLRKSKKPVFLTVNKVDGPKHELDLAEFYESGAKEIFFLSSAHGRGINHLLESLAEEIPQIRETEEEHADSVISIAVVGRPNVGKSSLVNSLLGEEKQIVHNEPGTTRDSIDSFFRYYGNTFRIIDTAGIRKKSKISELAEKYSAVSSLRSIERADVALLVIDATQGVLAQDTHIGGYIKDDYKAVVIVVNKWDLVEKDSVTLEKYREAIKERFKFLDYSPIIFVSALTGKRVPLILEKVKEVYSEYTKRVQTSDVNKIITSIVARHSPPRKGSKVTKIFFASQVSIKPPKFIITTNTPEAINFSYHRFMENRLRQHFGFHGCPIEILWKKKSRNEKRENGRKNGYSQS